MAIKVNYNLPWSEIPNGIKSGEVACRKPKPSPWMYYVREQISLEIILESVKTDTKQKKQSYFSVQPALEHQILPLH